jgi:YesN/AraC family two-component response regulator
MSPEHGDANTHKLVRQVDEIVRREFRRNLRVRDVAKRIGVTPNYLSALYRWEAGKTITRTLLERRVELAKELLQKTNLRIRQVARAVGFQSPYYFSRRFHQYQGISPKTYRQQVRGESRAAPSPGASRHPLPNREGHAP